MDRLHSMRVFAKVIDEGSFASAARSLDLSAAVVTRLVADLEAHLGARLIQRTTRRLALTDIGETYLERVRQILSEVEEAEALASAAVADPKGHLRVLVPGAFAVHQLAKHLPKFRQQCPKVTVDLTAGSAIEAADEAYDVSILIVGPRPLSGDFVARKLARTEVVACAAPSYLDQYGRPLRPEDLGGHECLVANLPNAPRTWRFEGCPLGRPSADGIEVEPRAALTTHHIDTLYAAALAGLGIVGLPSFMVEDALLESALERVLPEWRIMSYTIYAAMPSRKYVPARTRAFMDFLVGTFGAEDRDPWLAAAGCETPYLHGDNTAAEAAGERALA
ncbi:LysR family transcriptional regulator [Caldimonas brevitalea]|uniref:LysR family transcriptional regulator n=1 Tax=Caldimonas brevitalea TaxID=413882 RepID=A0A0G3BHW7_9BURK|nr:LysR family transcriptional regulator [Caldimonas brevitalea]AKJ26951.1 LysR family transcriptional regulator [Caldimonas brevitalea]